MGRVSRLFLDNFKSYQSPALEIGPFLHFTCVIGPNGSGKSNLMDAFAFVLGVHARDLRDVQQWAGSKGKSTGRAGWKPENSDF